MSEREGMREGVRGLWERLRGDEGESSIAVLLLVPVIMLAGFGLTVDWAGKVRASEEAVTLAQQAARAGVNAGLYGGSGKGDATLDRGQAHRGVVQFMGSTGAEYTVSTTNTSVIVNVTVDYEPKFIPAGTLQGTGHGEASAQSVSDQ